MVSPEMHKAPHVLCSRSLAALRRGAVCAILGCAVPSSPPPLGPFG